MTPSWTSITQHRPSIINFTFWHIRGNAVEDPEAEKEKLTTELNYTKGFLASVEKKLSNERFVANAPEKVIELERKKAADAKEKIVLLLKNLESL